MYFIMQNSRSLKDAFHLECELLDFKIHSASPEHALLCEN